MTGLTQPLVDLLENPAVIKVGLSLKDDFMMLHKRAPFTQQSCIELQDYVRQFGIQDKSLQKIYAKKRFPNHNGCPTGKRTY